MRLRTSIVLIATALSSSVCFAADTRQQEAFFEAKIRPVLVAQCYECHSAQSKDPQGGLLLDTREGIRRGGDNGHAVVPGELDDSLIISALKHESFEMPPEEQLSDEVIADFETWIRSGAHDPRDGKSAMIRREIDFDRAREFWSFQPIQSPVVPAVEDRAWPKSDIDTFILARLESKNASPVADADPLSLARRIYFDLIGLPPTPQQLQAFVTAYAKDSDAAIESLVDTLLDSKHFGERWGRHWMDVVRYAESTGMERNGTFTSAWRYRDYVIDALNEDIPYDQFIHEQIAGDLLEFQNTAERQRQLIATGMLALGPKSLNETKKEKFRMDVVDEQIDVVTRGFLGLTASCARCHDHKFDPIPQSEYYSLAGIFTSTDTLYGTSKTNGNRNPGRLLAITGDDFTPVATPSDARGKKEQQRYQTQLNGLQKRVDSIKRQLAKATVPKAKQAIQKKLKVAQDDVRRVNARLKRATQPQGEVDGKALMVMAVLESKKIADTKVRIRGEPSDYGREVPRGFLTIASLSEHAKPAPQRSGRLELARWITDTTNPLTARVAVNRVWQHLFGRGIVRTVNNFGANGDRPTHPQLLDHLAARFVDSGWSMKRLIRTIMLSHVYRIGSGDSASQLAIDPGNDLFWRMNQRRLEAEAIRDAMLMTSGILDLRPQSGSPVQKLGEGIIGRNLNSAQLTSAHRGRSVYLPIVRGGLPQFLTLFDFPEPSIIGGVRNVTTVPTQALFMLNNPQVMRCAKKLADRIGEETSEPHRRIRRAYLLTLSREPSETETQRAWEFIGDVKRMLTGEGKKSAAEIETIAWAGFCQSLYANAEFRYVN